MVYHNVGWHKYSSKILIFADILIMNEKESIRVRHQRRTNVGIALFGFCAIAVPAILLVCLNFNNVRILHKVNDSFNTAFEVITMALGSMSLIFLFIFWKCPVLQITGRSYLLWISILVFTSGLSKAFNSNVIGACIIHKLLYYISLNVITAILIVREWRTWNLQKQINEGVAHRFNTSPSVWYVITVLILTLLIVVFTKLLPPYLSGPSNFTPCEVAGHGEMPDWYDDLSLCYSLFYGLNHVVLLGFAILTRNLASICLDSSSTFLIAVCGFLYCSFEISTQFISVQQADKLLSLRIIEDSLLILMIFLVTSLMVFSRISFLNYSMGELVEEFLGGSPEFYSIFSSESQMNDLRIVNELKLELV